MAKLVIDMDQDGPEQQLQFKEAFGWISCVMYWP